MGSSKEVWAIGAAYERYVGRWSRRRAREFVAELAIAGGRPWLDVGCGTGALSATIVQEAAPAGITGIDRSPGFAAYARSALNEPRAAFLVADAQELPF